MQFLNDPDQLYLRMDYTASFTGWGLSAGLVTVILYIHRHHRVDYFRHGAGYYVGMG